MPNMPGSHLIFVCTCVSVTTSRVVAILENNYSKLCDRGLFMFPILYIRVALEFYKYFKPEYSLKCIKINQILIKLLIADYLIKYFSTLELFFVTLLAFIIYVLSIFSSRKHRKCKREFLFSVSNSKVVPSRFMNQIIEILIYKN